MQSTIEWLHMQQIEVWTQTHPAESIAIGLLALIAYLISNVGDRLRSIGYDVGMLRTELEVLQASVESIDMRGERIHPEDHNWYPD